MFIRKAALAAAAIAAFATLASAQSVYDLSPQQPGRPRTQPNPAAIAAIAGDARLVEPGVLTVATNASTPPLATYATDSATLVGADPDVAQLIADSLGLKLKLIPTPWADWPLGVASRKYDAAISNIGVTEQRKEKFDFSSYRAGLHGFFVKADSKVGKIAEPKDVAGLRIVLGGGTNQERILLEWSKQNLAAGLKPIELITFDDEANRLLALSSGRADVIVQPHAQLLFIQQRDRNIRRVGVLSAGWPERSDVAVATRKGAGLAQAITLALEGAYRDGTFDAALRRWGVEEERLEKPETNPRGLPKY